MRKKRIVPALFLSAMLALGLTGCQTNTEPKTTPISTSTEALSSSADVQITTEAASEAKTEAPEETTEEATTEAAPTEPQTFGAEPAMDPGTVWYVNTDQLNIRNAPGGDKTGELYRGEEIQVVSLTPEGWVLMHSASGDGYVSAEFLTSYKEKTNSTAPAEPQPDSAETTAPADNSVNVVPLSAGENGHVVCIDAGHQQAGISEQEPNGPGSSVMKAKLTTGTSGIATGLPEYQLNLSVSLLLKQTLNARGYQVIMIRETNDCPMSNAERAQLANNSGAEIFVRIHANSSDNPDVNGAMFYAPSAANPYLSQSVITASNSLAQTMLNSFCASTGLVNKGLLQDDGMTGINWCTIPVTIVEMGFMSNPAEDTKMADPAFQEVMAQGLANGIDAYFGIQ